MKEFRILLLFLLVTTSLKVASQTYFQHRIGLTSSESFYGGYFKDSTYVLAGFYDTTTSTSEMEGAWISNIDKKGQFIWNTVIFGALSQGFSDVTKVGDHYYAVGRALVQQYVDLDILIAKFDLNGNFIWAKTLGGGNFDDAASIDAVGDTAIVIAGAVESIGNGLSDLYIALLDTSGTILWDRSIGTERIETGPQVSHCNDGNLLLTGTISETVFYSGMAAKFDINGNLLWNYSYREGSFDKHVEDDQNVTHIIGQTRHPISRMRETWLVSIDAQGQVVNGKAWGTAFSTGGSAIEVLNDSSLIIAHWFGAPFLSNYSIDGDSLNWTRISQLDEDLPTQFIPQLGRDEQGNILAIFNYRRLASYHDAGLWKIASDGISPCLDSSFQMTDRSVQVSRMTRGALDSGLIVLNYPMSSISSFLPRIDTVCGPTNCGLNFNPQILNSTASCDGSLTISPSGGLAPYTFKWLNLPDTNIGVQTQLCPGDYCLAIEDANGFYKDTCFKVESTIGLREQAKEQFKVYPNPANGFIFLEGKLSANRVIMYDLAGKKVKEFQLQNNNGKIRLNFSDLNDGIYILQIISKGSSQEFKVINRKR